MRVRSLCARASAENCKDSQEATLNRKYHSEKNASPRIIELKQHDPASKHAQGEQPSQNSKDYP